MAYNIRTPEQLARHIEGIRASEFFDDFAKKREISRALEAYDMAVKGGAQNFVKVDVDHTKTLFRRIREDDKKPASYHKIVSIFMMMSLFSEEDGSVKLTIDELAKEVGTHKNNIYPILKYFREIGVMLQCEKGMVPCPEEFSASRVKIDYGKSRALADSAIYLNPLYVMKRPDYVRQAQRAAMAALKDNTPRGAAKSAGSLTGDLFNAAAAKKAGNAAEFMAAHGFRPPPEPKENAQGRQPLGVC